MATRWYLVQAKTGREALAQTHLRKQGFATYLPLTLRSVRRARDLRTVSSAYFPGYLFVAIDVETQRWRPIQSTIGVLRLLTDKERPLAAPRGLVEGLQARTSAGGVLDLAGGLEVGHAVRIIAGPLANQIGIVQRLADDAQRVQVLLSIMHMSVPVDVPRAQCALA